MLGHLLVLLVLNEKNMKGGNPYTPYKLPYLYLRGVGLGAGAAGSFFCCLNWINDLLLQ